MSSTLWRRLPAMLGILFALPARAFAQTAPPATASTPATPPHPAEAAVTPPAVQGNTDVPYPPGAQGDAVVLLAVDLDRDGRVTNAIVIEGSEPFAEQARRAVLRWQFTPARRGTTPVAARIHARVRFHQEESPSTPSPTAVPPAAPGTPATSPAPPPALASTSSVVLEVPEEVNVHGARHELGETTLSAADVREMPGAFGDPFRAIEGLPGVIPVVSGLPYFYIRGAPPTNNAYLVDGI
ncbi:MAG TPA: TonB family protein, partial [Polyangiaceae bacterium]